MYDVVGRNSSGAAVVCIEAYTYRAAKEAMQRVVAESFLYPGIEQVTVEHDEDGFMLRTVILENL